MIEIVDDWRKLSDKDRQDAINDLVAMVVDGEPVPEIRGAKCRCGATQEAPNAPRIPLLYVKGWRWKLAHHVPLDFSGVAGAARWICPDCPRPS